MNSGCFLKYSLIPLCRARHGDPLGVLRIRQALPDAGRYVSQVNGQRKILRDIKDRCDLLSNQKGYAGLLDVRTTLVECRIAFLELGNLNLHRRKALYPERYDAPMNACLEL